MKKIIFFLLLTAVSRAQYIHPFEYFNFDYVSNNLEYFPIGNIGFDTKLNPYNPNIIKDDSFLFLNASVISNLSQTVKENGTKYFIEDRKIFPNFIAQYQKDWFGFQLGYINNNLSSHEGINTNWFFNFQPDLNTDILFIPARNSVIQLSSIFVLSGEVNLSAGIITNNFETQFIFPDQGYVKYKRDFFDNFQINLALNINHNDFIKGYILFRSENSDNKLKIEHSLNSIPQPALDHPDLFFNGLVGAGIKIMVLDNLGVSLESKNDSVNYEKKSPYIFYNPNFYSVNEGGGEINSKLIAGVNMKPLDFLQLGVLYSRYVRYKNPFLNAGPVNEYTTLPYAIILGAKVEYQKFDMNLFYQMSGDEFKYAASNEYKTEKVNHYLGFGVGIKLL